MQLKSKSKSKFEFELLKFNSFFLFRKDSEMDVLVLLLEVGMSSVGFQGKRRLAFRDENNRTDLGRLNGLLTSKTNVVLLCVLCVDV